MTRIQRARHPVSLFTLVKVFFLGLGALVVAFVLMHFGVIGRHANWAVLGYVLSLWTHHLVHYMIWIHRTLL